MHRSNIKSRTRSVPDRAGKRSASRRGLTLTEFIVTLLLCLLAIAATRSAAARVALVCLGLTIVWARVYLRAPELTCNASVLIVIGVLTLSLLPIRLLDMREEARRQTARNSLRRIGQVIHALNDAGTPGPVEDRLNDHERAVAGDARSR